MGFVSLPLKSGSRALVYASFASFPVLGVEGQFYYDDTGNDMYYWNGSSYVQTSGSSGIANTDDLLEGATNRYFTNARADARITVHVDQGDPHPQYALESQIETYFEEQMVFQNYQVNNTDDAGGGVTYVGKAKIDGKWLIEKLTEAADDIVKVYANESNNIGTSAYTTAWTNRASLTYGQVQTLTGL